MDQILIDKDIKLLADSGYRFYRLITPVSANGLIWNNLHKKYRSIVERVFGLVKLWNTAGGVFRLSPEIQELCILADYQLGNMYIKEFPLLDF